MSNRFYFLNERVPQKLVSTAPLLWLELQRFGSKINEIF